MSVFRRSSKPETESQAAPAPVETAPMRVPPHVERALITLTTKMQQCLERLDAIEARLDDLSEITMNTPSHSDVMEVRMHSAKLAAELARATVELRGEIGMASDEARRAARLTRSLVEDEPPVSLPVDIDLTGPRLVEDNEDEHDDTERKGKGWSEAG